MEGYRGWYHSSLEGDVPMVTDSIIVVGGEEATLPKGGLVVVLVAAHAA